MQRLLWIDDAASYMLRPISRMLARRDFDIKILNYYQEAVEELDRLEELGFGTEEAFPNVIVDLLIPRAEGGALDSLEVGFSLASRCATLGAQRIAIFSVVARARVSHDFGVLTSAFPATKFFYLEKTSGRPEVLVNHLADFLRLSQPMRKVRSANA